jgi:hypothetical protein
MLPAHDSALTHFDELIGVYRSATDGGKCAGRPVTPR